MIVTSLVLLGAGILGTEGSSAPPALPGVVVEPSAEALDRRAAAALRAETIREAAEHYRIEPGLAARIHDAARAEGISPRLAYGLVRVESRFDPAAVSPVGALGLTQVMPATARGLDPEMERVDLLDPDTNLELGMRYLRELLERYDGDRRLALTAYNRGPGTVARARSAGEEPYNGYAGLVLEHRLPRQAARVGARGP